MAAFNFPNSPSLNQTHTENSVQWKWNGSVWKRVESVAQKGQKGQKGEDNSTKGQKGDAEEKGNKGQKGEVGADNSTKGQKGETGSGGSSNASTATIRTESDNAQHPIIFVDSNTDNQNQTLKMDDDDRLSWNPTSELLVAQNVASNMLLTWSGVSPGNAGDILISGGSSAGWSWNNSLSNLSITTLAVADIKRGVNNADVNIITEGSGKFTVHRDSELRDVYPETDATHDLGTNSKRWRDLYINDLALSNESKKDTGGNDVDGTWGDWRIQEGESDLFIINNRNGKKYKFNLTEVS